MLGPVLSRVTNLPVAGDEVFGATRRFYDRLDGVKELLADRERTSVRLVVNPERMVIAEARRTYTYLSLFGYRVDAVVANRLLPDEVDRPVVRPVAGGPGRAPGHHRRGVRAAAGPAGARSPTTSWSASIGCGASPREVYGERRSAGRAARHEPLEIVKPTATLRSSCLELPFADHDDLDVGRRGDELLVRVGPYRRALLLPDSLRRREVTAASLRKGDSALPLARPASVRPGRCVGRRDERPGRTANRKTGRTEAR